MMAGKIFKSQPDRMETALIKFNNRLTDKIKSKPRKLLILVPSCIQNKDCANNLIADAENCRQCGKCKIKDLLALSREYKLALAVTTGGRLARKVLDESGADAVIAIACEKELISGIIDVYPVRVKAIMNSRPFGPCVNTDVDVGQVKTALSSFCQ
jgi:hypothetical protein